MSLRCSICGVEVKDVEIEREEAYTLNTECGDITGAIHNKCISDIREEKSVDCSLFLNIKQKKREL